VAPDGAVLVRVDTSWPSKSLTAETAATDFQFAQSTLGELVFASDPFASAVRGRAVRFELIEDYGTGSVLLCTLEEGSMTWSAGAAPGVEPPSLEKNPDVLPAEVIAPTLRWFNAMDEGLVGLAKAARGFDPPIGPTLALAVSDLADRIAHFRRALVSDTVRCDLLPANAAPLMVVDRDTAQVIHLDVLRVATLPADLTSAAREHLANDSLRRAFLRQVGDIAGMAFVNLARSLWKAHPDLAPLGWKDSG
jgi:hypothetical protein